MIKLLCFDCDIAFPSPTLKLGDDEAERGVLAPQGIALSSNRSEFST